MPAVTSDILASDGPSTGEGQMEEFKMTDAELVAISARAEAATEGPWLYEQDAIRAGHATCELGETLAHIIAGKNRSAGLAYCDATFIASAREDVPRLVADLTRTREIVAEQADVILTLTRYNRYRHDSEIIHMLKHNQFKMNMDELLQAAREIDPWIKSLTYLCSDDTGTFTFEFEPYRVTVR